jgi:hypothetical protein
MATVIAMIVVAISVIHRSWSAASINPVNTIKNE